MDRLERQYQREAAKFGYELRVFNEREINMASKLARSGAVVLFTGKVSHEARIHTLAAAKARAIPLLQCHSCGVSSLRECLRCIARSEASGTRPPASAAAGIGREGAA
jgi:hypothetical protein